MTERTALDADVLVIALMIDDHTRVLDEQGKVIPGLLAAGVDASVYHTLYGGGLSLALATGLKAGLIASGQEAA